jgi:hypothetical protein
MGLLFGALGRHRKRAFFAWLLLFACTPALRAQVLDYGNYSGYDIRKGILGNDYTSPLAACITGSEADVPQSTAGFRASIVYTADEYKQAFHIDQQAQASFLNIGGGSDELHLGRETGRSGSAFDIIIEAYGQHPARTVNNVKWDSKYEAMLNSGDPLQKQQVRQDCGDRYIETVFKETRLFAVLHVSSQQGSSLTQFAGKMNGSVGISVLSASGSLGGDINISSAYKAGAITVDIYTEGLGGISPTAGLIGITSANGLQDVADKLAAYLPKLQDVGQPVKVQLAPLPGMSGGDLSDTRVFVYLNALKRQYADTNARLENVHSLLIGGDPRRVLLRQPEADTALKHQQEKLTENVDAIAAAHDRCRKAFSLSECEGLAKAFDTPLPRDRVELMLVVPPAIPSFVFAIDGIPVPPSQSRELFPQQGKTLLEKARMLQPGASNVDLVAPVFNGDYLASITIPVFVIQANLPSQVGSVTLRGADLTLPPYLKGPFTFPPQATTFPPQGTVNYSSTMFTPWWDLASVQSPPGLPVLHADVTHPCGTSTGGGATFWEAGCLTPQGHALWAAVLAAVASNANNPAIQQPISYFANSMPWFLNDCFGNFASPRWVPPSWFPPTWDWFSYNAKKPGQVSASVMLRAYIGPGNGFEDPYLPIMAEDEAHDQTTWAQLARQRLVDLAALNGSSGNGPNRCAPHIP